MSANHKGNGTKIRAIIVPAALLLAISIMLLLQPAEPDTTVSIRYDLHIADERERIDRETAQAIHDELNRIEAERIERERLEVERKALEQISPGTAQTPSKDGMSFSGYYTVTYYCHCKICCGKSNGITASGEVAQEGITVASNSHQIGTRIYIEGLGWRIVQDRGGMGKSTLDVYVSSHSKALQLGRKKGVAVYTG